MAQAAGYDHVAALWKKLGVGTAPKAYPSIALGVFEATPFEIATAYTLFPNGGTIRPLKHILRITSGGKDVTKKDTRQPKEVARPETTFLVTNMMRSVLNEGTAAGARAAGFVLDAAGKTGTTNDLRDAWFVGFTPDLITVVWVGFDDNQPVGLSGIAGGAAHLDAVHEDRARRPRRACRSTHPKASRTSTSTQRPASWPRRAVRKRSTRRSSPARSRRACTASI